MKTLQFIKKVTLAASIFCIWMPVAIMAKGNGTQRNPFQVNSATLLAKVGSGTDGWTLSAHYKQTANIDIGGINNWTPIGTEATPFTGTYDGDGKTISNLKINDSGNDNKGLFGYINGVVKNVRMNTVVITGKNRIGGVAGQIIGGTVQNCYVVNINIEGNDIVGGVAGGNSGNGNIINCYATGRIIGNSTIGGLVGVNAATVQNCYAVVNISGGDVGGVVGQNNGTLQNCYATGNAEGSWAGGVAGGNSGTLQFCYTTGGVDGTWAGGGVAGRNMGGTISNCVALNYKVHGNFGGRVIESGRGTLSNNYARESGMTIGVDLTPSDASGIHGEDATAANTHGGNSGTWWSSTAGFSSTLWSFSNGRLPWLRGFEGITQNPEVK